MRHDPTLDGVPDPLWRLLSLARHRLLMLDYDGTLAPFAVARHEARPHPGSLEVLRHIAAGNHTSLAVVSGRPVREVERFLGTIPAVFVGEHGWERRLSDGRVVQRPIDDLVAATIEEAARIAHASGWGDLLERKRSAVVLHTRALAADRAVAVEARCMAAWSRLDRAGRVAVDRIHGGVELRARGRNKGTVVWSLLTESPPGTLGVFVGDDVTDEDAFDVVRDWGFGVRVGDPTVPSLAMGRLPSCETLPRFLAEWLAVAERATSMRVEE